MLLPQDDLDPDVVKLIQIAGARSFNDLVRSVERAGIDKAPRPDEVRTGVLHMQCEEPWAVHKASDTAAWLAVPGNIENLCTELSIASMHAGISCLSFPPRYSGPPVIW